MRNGINRHRRGVITVEAALVMPVVIGVLVLLYSLAIIEYQNVTARAEAMRAANRAAMNWNTIGGSYTIFDEDQKETVFSGENQLDEQTGKGKSGKNVITSGTYAEHDPYRFFTELFAVGSKKQSNMRKYLDSRMAAVSKLETGIEATTTDQGITGNSAIHIFNRYVSVTIDNTYGGNIMAFLDGIGFPVKKDYRVTAKAKLTEPADFVRNVSYIQEIIRNKKKKQK